MSQLIAIKQLTEADLRGKRVLLRLDLNVPIEEGVVSNTFRLDKVKPTIDWLVGQGARVLILSHLGDETGSLRPVANYFQQSFPIGFIEKIEDLANWEQRPEAVVLLENLRRYPGEMANDHDFAKQLAEAGDLYVNDAFPVSHRAHASIVGLPALLPSYAGFTFMHEVENLALALKPESPAVLILGGAKFETKIPLIQKFLTIADRIFIGGALASSCLKASGLEVGSSLVDDKLELLKPFLNQPKIMVPTDVVIKTASGEIKTVPVEAVPADAKIVDVGEGSLKILAETLVGVKMVLWNGPLGYFEVGFSAGTEELARILSDLPAKTIVGGGDTVAAIEKLGLMDKFTFVSTAGGAMLDYLADGSLPGIEALVESQKKFGLIK